MDIKNRIEAEEVILGSLWIDWKNMYIDIVTENLFSKEEHKRIFNILRIYPEIRADFTLLKLKLTEEKEYFPIARQLLNFATKVSSVDQIPDYVKLLEDSKSREKIFELVNTEAGRLSGREMEMIHELTEKKEEKEEHFNTFEDLSLDFMDVLDKRKESFKQGFPYPTGIKTLDSKIGGIKPSQVLVIGGRTSVGKSSIMTQFACNLASKKKTVAYFTGEMIGQDLFDRIIASKASVEAYKIKYGKIGDEERNRIIEVLNTDNFYKTPLQIYFMPIMTMSKIKRIIEDTKPEIVFIDHIQLLSLEKSDSVAQAISEAMSEFKRIAGEKNIGIIIGSQLSRAIEHTTAKGKGFSNAFFKGSGGIEESADVAMKLEIEEGETKDNIEWKMILEITKNRCGRIGSVYLTFQRQFLKFIEREV